MMTAHRSTDGAAPSLIHGCRAPPHPTPAGAIAPGRAGTPPRAAARLPSSPQPLLHSPHQNPAPRSRRPGNVGRMPAITRAAASASPRVSRHATPHFCTLRRPGRTLALILACVAALPASQRASEPARHPSSPAVLRFARESPSPSSWSPARRDKRILPPLNITQVPSSMRRQGGGGDPG